MTRLHLYRKRSRGQVYFRHPTTDQLTRLPDDETSQAFEDAYQALLATVGAVVRVERTVRPAAFRPGAIGWFIERYRASAKFAKLAASTRKQYAIAFELMS